MKKHASFLMVGAILLGLLAACAPKTVVVTEQVEVPVEVTKIVAGTPETIIVTATPEPEAPAPEKPSGKIVLWG